MNYTIYITIGVFKIGEQEFTSTPTKLVKIACLIEEFYSELFTRVKSKDLEIQLNNETLDNSLPIISKLITLSNENTESGNVDSLLLEDWENKRRFDKMDFGGDDILEEIDASYEPKKTDGYNYFRKNRAELVKEINAGRRDSKDTFVIDKATKNARFAIKDGDWVSAKYYLEEAQTVGAFTDEVKNAFMDDINAYIANNY